MLWMQVLHLISLHPVPFNGEVISSQTGEYRIRKRNTRKGTHILEMRKGANGNLQVSYSLNLQTNGK